MFDSSRPGGKRRSAPLSRTRIKTAAVRFSWI